MFIVCLVICLIFSIFFLISCLIPFFQRLRHSECTSEFRLSSLFLFLWFLLLSVALFTKVTGGGELHDTEHIASYSPMVREHMGGNK